MIKRSGEQAVISTRRAKEDLAENVHMSTDIREMRKPDRWLSGRRVFQALAQTVQCKGPEVAVCSWCIPGAASTCVAAQSEPGEEYAVRLDFMRPEDQCKDSNPY